MLRLFVPSEMKTVVAGLSAVLLLALVVAAPAAQASACTLDGAGTEGAPYRIDVEADFAKVGVGDCAANAHYLLTGSVELAATYDQSVVAGTFQGLFDGGGFTISSMQIATAAQHAVGFFAHVDGGTVKDVIFHAPQIDVSVDEVGVVVGLLDAGTVKGITVRDPQVKGGSKVGGVVGFAQHSASFSDVHVIAGEVTGVSRVGGVVGELFADVRSAGGDVEMTFRHLESSANVNGAGNNVGGIAGLLAANARATLDADDNCPAALDQNAVLVLENVHVVETAEVKNSGGRTGGLVGRIETYANCDGTRATTRILDSTVSADVEGSNNTAGLVGQLATDAGAPMNIEIARVRFDGTVTSTRGDSAGLVGQLFRGNKVNATIEDATVVGHISGSNTGIGGIIGKADMFDLDGPAGSLAIRRAVVSGTVTGSRYVGGVAGYVSGDEVSVAQATFLGTVEATGSDVGGVVGEQRSGAVVHDVLVRGQVQGRSTSTTRYTGGVVGYLAQTSQVERAVSVAKVEAASEHRAGLGFGRVGADATISHVRVATDVAGSTTDDLVGEGPDAGVADNTLAELQQIATYVDWPMVQGWEPAHPDPSQGRVWGICPQVNDGYPFLLWRYNADPCVDPASTDVPTVADVEGTLVCSAPVVGVDSVCVLTATPDRTFVWEARTNPVFASGEVRTDASGVGEFSFAVSESLLGSEIVVQVIGVVDSTTPIGVASPPVPAAVPAGEGVAGWQMMFGRVISVGLLAAALFAFAIGVPVAKRPSLATHCGDEVRPRVKRRLNR